MQIAAHASLVGDDSCVLRVGLSVAAIGRRGMVNSPARNIDEFVIALDEQGDQQSGAAGVEVYGPQNPAAVG